MTVLSATITMVDVPLNFIRQAGIERAAIAQNRWLQQLGYSVLIPGPGSGELSREIVQSSGGVATGAGTWGFASLLDESLSGSS